MIKMDFDDAVSWLDATQQFGMKPGLHRINILLQHLDHPERSLQCIHVGGTNGKGSVCHYLLSILRKEGYCVGLFTSPHLETVRERFCINHNLISKEEFAGLISTLKPVVDTLNNENIYPTYFELCTALAFLYFKRHHVDFAIVEVGLGGRYDSTNVIHPILTIITNVSFDHQHILGESIEKIATEKAGIIKDHVTVVTAADDIALHIIKKHAEILHANVIVVKRDTSRVIKQSSECQIIKIKGVCDEYLLTTCEIGRYQEQNLSVAIHAIEQLQNNGFKISHKSIKNGVWEMIHPGRMKILSNNPEVIIDGAHNPAGIVLLKQTVNELFPQRKIILVFGVLKDKNVEEMIQELGSFCHIIILTEPDSTRAKDPEELLSLCSSLFPQDHIYVEKKIHDACEKACQLVDEKGIILIVGSLYLVKDAVSFFEKF